MAYSTIDKSRNNFNTILWTGNGSLPRAITGVGFSPDLVWAKDRDTAYNPQWHDSVRGIDEGAIYSNANNANDTTYHMDSFDNDGFTMGTDLAAINENTKKIVAWNWLAGGKSPTQTYKVVVVSDSGNKYRFRNSTDTATFGTSAVTLDLQEGGTYTFDVSDSTVNSHPFVLGTSSGVDGSYSTGVTYKLDGVTKTYSQYTSGFSSATSRQLIITVAASAPTLYYNCSVHSGMGGQINTNASHGSSNFDGTIQTLVSANTTAGFSIIKWTADGSSNNAVGHGLGTAPKVYLYKRVDSTGNWYWRLNAVVDSSQDYLQFNSTNGKADDSASYNAPSDTLINNYGYSNSNVVIAYCFAEIQGYSRFGYYDGNGDSNGPFIYTGFKPAFTILKRTDGSDWFGVGDNKRQTAVNDGSRKNLTANTSDVEGTLALDYFSNGFKIRSSNGGVNADGGKYIYMSFGQSIVGSNNIPATAR